MTRLSPTWLMLLALPMHGCDDGAQSSADSGLAEACLESDLIAQCPLGSNPVGGTTATSLCASAVDGNLMNAEGAVSGRCFGEGSCFVACQFAVPCRCGVQSVTRDGVVCVDCGEAGACGDGRCTGGEDPETCPQDCAGECEPGAERCVDRDRQACSLRGQWEDIACAADEVCVEIADGVECRRSDLVEGRDGGVDDPDAGPRPSGRIEDGDGTWPGTGEHVRPGAGRDLTFRGAVGFKRSCTGGSVAVNRRCESRKAADPRDGLLNEGFGGFTISMPADGPYVAGWGSRSVMSFGIDGAAPPDAVEPPAFAAWCAAYWPCLVRSAATTCEDAVAAIDAGGELPEAVAALVAEHADFGRRYGGPGAACVLEMAGGDCPDQPTARMCRYDWRVLGFSDAVVQPVTVDSGVLSADGMWMVHRNALGDGDGSITWCSACAQDDALEREVMVYNLGTGENRLLGRTGNYHLIGGRTLAISADNSTVAVGAVSGEWIRERGWHFVQEGAVLLVWSIEGGEPTAIPFGGNPLKLALSPNGAVLAVLRGAVNDLTPTGVEIWNVAERRRVFTILPAPEYCSGGRGFAFSPRGDELAVGAFGDCAAGAQSEIWDLSAREKRATLPNPSRAASFDLVYSPDGSTLAGVYGTAIALWDTTRWASTVLETGEMAFHGDRATVRGISYSPGGTWLLLWGGPGLEGDDLFSLSARLYGPPE